MKINFKSYLIFVLFIFRFINVKYGSETGTILLHEGDKVDLKNLKPKFAQIFNLEISKFELTEEKSIVIAKLKE